MDVCQRFYCVCVVMCTQQPCDRADPTWQKHFQVTTSFIISESVFNDNGPCSLIRQIRRGGGGWWRRERGEEVVQWRASPHTDICQAPLLVHYWPCRKGVAVSEGPQELDCLSVGRLLDTFGPRKHTRRVPPSLHPQKVLSTSHGFRREQKCPSDET
jgi:hypothetical protein